MKILLIHGEDETRQMISFSLESKFKAEVIECGTLAAAMDTLRIPKDPISLIIYPEAMETLPEFPDYYPLTGTVPQIVISAAKYESSANPGVVASVSAAKVVDSLFETIKDLIAKKKVHEDGVEGEFCRIRTNLLVKVSPLKGDIYIRLSPIKYIKLFMEGDTFDRQDLEKYLEKKKLPFLYLKTADTAEFVTKYRVLLNGILQDPTVQPEKAMQTVTDVQETIQELSRKIGFTEEVKEFTKQNVQLAVKAMDKNPTFKSVLSRIENEKGRYIANHSTVLAHIACAVAKGMTWSSDITYYKLTLAAMLHDITLKNDEIAKIRTLKELDAKKDLFKPSEIESYKKHVSEAANIARQFSEVPPDVDTIILQHHERPDGSGFPRRLAGPYINNLSAIFIVAHEIVQQSIEDGKDIAAVIKDLRSQYDSGAFKKILASVATLS